MMSTSQLERVHSYLSPTSDQIHSYACGKCQLTTCYSLHSYSGSSCSYKTCSDCRELQVLDTQITEIHDILINLSQKRHELKERINRRHDTLTSRLPLEVVSNIFSLITQSDPDDPKCYIQNDFVSHPWNPVFLLGAVCRHWRDITLGSAHLWTTVKIDPWKLEHTSPEITRQWLSRSYALPLSLNIDATDRDHPPQPFPTIPYSNIVPFLRSHASRWKDLTLRVPMSALQMLLEGLEDRLSVDSLNIQIVSHTPREADEITMEYPLIPKRLRIQRLRLSLIPIHWYRLTHLEAIYISIDAILHVFRHAQNLQYCLLYSIESNEDRYPTPSSPVLNRSIKELDAKINGNAFGMSPFLRHLNFPSLETLRYGVAFTNQEEEVRVLSNFVDRSQPPLHEFWLYYADNIPRLRTDWFGMLPLLTSLELDIQCADSDGERLQQYIQGLANDAVPMVLPCLQELTIKAKAMSGEFWDALVAMFPEETSAISRPLNTVVISLDSLLGGHDIMLRRDTYSHLRAIRESGVTLNVFNRYGIEVHPLGPDDILTSNDGYYD